MVGKKGLGQFDSRAEADRFRGSLSTTLSNTTPLLFSISALTPGRRA